MAKTSADYEKAFVEGLEASTGKRLKEWMTIMDQVGLSKHNEMLAHMKKEHGFNHMQANFLTYIHKNDGKPVYSSGDDATAALFAKKEAWRPIYDKLADLISSNVADTQFIPKKGYMSISGKREYAVARIMTKEIRVGMDLGEKPFDDYVQKGKGLGAMPRISHMVVVKEEADLNGDLVALLQEADTRVNG